jgi:hypothetical protein
VFWRVKIGSLTPLDHPAADRWSPNPDFGGRFVRVLEYDRPVSGGDDDYTRQAVMAMHHLATRDAHSHAVRECAVAAARQFEGHTTAQELADAIFDHVQQLVAYEYEDQMQTPFTDMARIIYDQTLIAPSALLQMPKPRTDCVGFSMLVASMCRLFGIPTAYKTIAAEPGSEAFSHVYVIAQLAPGRFYALDASNAPGPGFEFDLPTGKKSKVWPNPADLLEGPFMIHDQRSRLGELSEDGVPIYDGANPSGDGGSGWTDLVQTIVDDASKIAAPLIRQDSIKAPYYIAGANGAQILYDPSTGKTANAGAASQRTPAVISQNLLIGAGVLAAVLVALSFNKHK